VASTIGSLKLLAAATPMARLAVDKMPSFAPRQLPEASCFAEYNAVLNNYPFFPQCLKVSCYSTKTKSPGAMKGGKLHITFKLSAKACAYKDTLIRPL
jgi:hypothetical protein